MYQQPTQQLPQGQVQQVPPAGTPGWVIGLGVAALLVLAAYVLKLGPFAPTQKYPSDWVCAGDIDVPIRRENNPAKDISCMSTNGRDCVWGGCASRLSEFSARQSEMQPLVCGPMHANVWGGPGYDVPEHWCYKGNTLIPKPQ